MDLRACRTNSTTTNCVQCAMCISLEQKENSLCHCWLALLAAAVKCREFSNNNYYHRVQIRILEMYIVLAKRNGQNNCRTWTWARPIVFVAIFIRMQKKSFRFCRQNVHTRLFWDWDSGTEHTHNIHAYEHTALDILVYTCHICIFYGIEL